jgi:hypothetical protein
MTNHLPLILSPHWRSNAVHKACALSLLLLCLPMAADALSLGRSRGAAIVGRSLDMSVLASLEALEATPDVSCFSTELFYGDTRIPGPNVTVTPLRSSPTEMILRVQSSRPIDEPFVTLYVRTTCGTSLSRKYVLLADSPSEPASTAQSIAPVLSPPEPRLPQLASQSSSTPTSASGRSSGLAVGGVSDAASRALDRQAALEARRLERQLQRGLTGNLESFASADGRFASPAPSAASIARRKTRMQAAAEQRAQARAAAPVQPAASRGDRLALSPSLGSSTQAASGRLNVDVLESAGGRGPNLRSSAELLTQPSTDEKTRTQAAALWRMLSSSPQDLLRDADRLKALEAEVRTMSALTIRQTQELGTVKGDLAKAKTEKFANPLVYGLGALSLASLGFGLWAWRRRQPSAAAGPAPWWGDADKMPANEAPGPRASSVVHPSQAATGKKTKTTGFAPINKAQTLEPMSGLTNYAPVSVVEDSPSGFDSYAAESGAAVNRPIPARSSKGARAGMDASDSGYGAAVGGSGNRVNAEELFDIQQQADFFLSLGQHDQAIDVLQNHISENLETSAVAYLDLFDIYHKVNKREEFDSLREEFNRVFNAQVPEFDNYGRTSRGLEDYASAMQRIQALWPSAKVLDVIEESIFRKPDRDNQPFDLVAYRELMLLYGVAKEISEPVVDPDDDARDVDFDLTSPGSGNAANSAGAQSAGFTHTEVHPLSADVPSSAFGTLPASHNLGLDIDLGIFDAPMAPAATAAGPSKTPKVTLATASIAAPVLAAVAAKPLDNAINFDLTIDSKFMPPMKKK